MTLRGIVRISRSLGSLCQHMHRCVPGRPGISVLATWSPLKGFSGNRVHDTNSARGSITGIAMLSLIVNVVIPTIIMTRFAGDDQLGAVPALLLALAFPLVYGIYEMAKAKKVGWMPVLGIVSILISGGIGLLKLPAEWIAVKEAMIPFILAMAILISSWIGKPLARIFIDA